MPAFGLAIGAGLIIFLTWSPAKILDRINMSVLDINGTIARFRNTFCNHHLPLQPSYSRHSWQT